MEIENADMKIIKWLQQFHNKSYATSCYWWVKHVNIKPKLELETTYHIRFIMKILWPHKIYYKNIVNIALLLFLLNTNSCDF